MMISIRQAIEADIDASAQAMYIAFLAIDKRHHFSSYFTDLDHARMTSRNLITNDNIYGLVAEADGRIVGSAFMNETRPIRAIGPVSVHPDFQNRGIGHKLMDMLLNRAGDAPSVRLTQDAFNTGSLALYTSLGFNTVEFLALIQGKIKSQPPSDIKFRPVFKTDYENCIALCQKVVGFDRVPSNPIDMYCVTRNNRITAYTVDLSTDGYTLGETETDIQALILNMAAQKSGELAFLVPTSYSDLLRWCLNEGLRVTKALTLMVKGDYQTPSGIYLPNLLY